MLDDTQNKGSFRLSVEAVVYRNGQSNEIVSSTILQEDFSVVPKCCKIPFGSHQDSTSNTEKGTATAIMPLIATNSQAIAACCLGLILKDMELLLKLEAMEDLSS